MSGREVYSPPPEIVFDAEPLVAHADEEPGYEKVAAYLDAVADGVSQGYLNRVNATEVRYILGRKYGESVADEYFEWLGTIGIHPTQGQRVWETASDYILDYNPALGDAYALATADRLGATLLIGGDDDYNEIIADADACLSIERFRHGSA
ncbi:type II toxin-antitoxin system VapC family toxin [Halorubrum tropicale]|nr:PIN domain-containing protein [Halorubrum tropicale]